ncbi:MAG: TetR family transcriptional regulator [Robiginitomaculum sp.]|nr:MAG: TetR family transcriptional regulator [Robiginitomaculum sp.]
MVVLTQRAPIQVPKQKRSRETYENLLSAAGNVLREEGFESLTTNTIVERAGLTPPAFYRYFVDKFDILTVLGKRLMDVQNTVVEDILDASDEPENFATTVAQLEDILRLTLKCTEDFVGGPWVMRSLRAVPSLQNIRTDSHIKMANAICDGYLKFHPKAKRSEIYHQARLSIEIGYAALELIFDEPNIDRDCIIQNTAIAIDAFYLTPPL